MTNVRSPALQLARARCFTLQNIRFGQLVASSNIISDQRACRFGRRKRFRRRFQIPLPSQLSASILLWLLRARRSSRPSAIVCGLLRNRQSRLCTTSKLWLTKVPLSIDGLSSIGRGIFFCVAACPHAKRPPSAHPLPGKLSLNPQMNKRQDGSIRGCRGAGRPRSGAAFRRQIAHDRPADFP